MLTFAATLAFALLAQPPATPAPPSPDDTITVTGQRPIPGTGLVVNLDRVATSCIACRRALERLRREATRTRQRIRLEEDDIAAISTVARAPNFPPGLTVSYTPGGPFQVLAETRQRSANDMAIHARRALANHTRPVVTASALYMRNLMRLVTPILERIGAERRAAYIYRVGDPRARRSFPSITDLVIRELDRTAPDVDLLEGVTAPDQAQQERGRAGRR